MTRSPRFKPRRRLRKDTSNCKFVSIFPCQCIKSAHTSVNVGAVLISYPVFVIWHNQLLFVFWSGQRNNWLCQTTYRTQFLLFGTIDCNSFSGVVSITIDCAKQQRLGMRSTPPQHSPDTDTAPATSTKETGAIPFLSSFPTLQKLWYYYTYTCYVCMHYTAHPLHMTLCHINSKMSKRIENYTWFLFKAGGEMLDIYILIQCTPALFHVPATRKVMTDGSLSWLVLTWLDSTLIKNHILSAT